MHTKPDLRVFLKWSIAGSGSVITDVIQFMNETEHLHLRQEFLDFVGEEDFTEFAHQTLYFLYKTWSVLPPQLGGIWHEFCDSRNLQISSFSIVCKTVLWCCKHEKPVTYNRQAMFKSQKLERSTIKPIRFGIARNAPIIEAICPFGEGFINCETCSEILMNWLHDNSVDYNIYEKPGGVPPWEDGSLDTLRQADP